MSSSDTRSANGKYGIRSVLCWTALIFLLAGFTLYSYHTDTLRDAESEAKDYFRFNMYYRLWIAKVGGVYVSTDRIAPSPYLQLADRDIVSTDGKRYTLVNPAYLTRMVFESFKTSSPTPVVATITSLKPLNPANAPDEWERQSLQGFEGHQYSERSEVTTLNGEPYLRFIAAFVTEDACLKCHAEQGYRKGDVRGGIAVAVPLSHRYEVERKADLKIVSGYLVVWLLGSIGMTRSAHRQWAYRRELEASEKKLRTVCDWTLDWDYWIDVDGNMQYVSPSCLKITGYSSDQFMRDPELVRRIVHPDHADVFCEHISGHISADSPDSDRLEFKIITRDKEVRWIQHHCAPIFEGHEFKGRRVSNRDITEQKIANEKIGVLSAIVESSSDAIFSQSLAGTALSWNRGAEKLFGYSEREMIGKSVLCLYPLDRVHEEKEILETVGRGESVDNCETVLVHQNGSLLDVSVTVSPIRDEGSGTITGVSTIIRDISEVKREASERVRIERKMLHAQKLESLGVLAGGIAHDFNNILTAIIGNASLALTRVESDSPVRVNLQNVQKAASRAADLTRQMLAYSGKGTFSIENISINALVQEMTHMLEVSISKNVQLKMDLHLPLPPVAADATQIRQIIMNLVINASEAIGEKPGTITISTGCMNCDRSYLQQISVDEDLPEGLYVFFEVDDNGCGMDRETLARIYDPFFTTKFTGRGLGMAAVQGIIRGHKGAIKIYSEPGKGSTFKVFLPATGRETTGFAARSSVEGTWMGSGTVLLVDDEAAVLQIGSEMLQEMGFDTVTAGNGVQGLERFREYRDKISCVILDLTMPLMDGAQTFSELRQLDPEVKVIMSSGYNESEVVGKFTGQGLAGFIQKPYTFTALREAIYKVLKVS
ncbi:PAS domain S-box protein [Geomonas sp.]|uniref:hybrid sensor histidine kinase/response regulator n=1 Tax=Geomonas sp. TaxID=2651584 RepID=UPI002B46D6A9|nr:PAS domain S-box protein [Geomonas sp.]HJV35136.1 PAS domain S-box protein [Geomonas sp.]